MQESLTPDKIKDMMNLCNPKFSDFAGFKIVESKLVPDLKEVTSTTLRIPAHPLIVWLSKWFNIVPYTELVVERVELKPQAFVFKDLLMCSPLMTSAIISNSPII